MKKILLSAVLMGMLALGFTTSTEACHAPQQHRPPSIHTINRNPDHNFNKVREVQDKRPRFGCGGVHGVGITRINPHIPPHIQRNIRH